MVLPRAFPRAVNFTAFLNLFSQFDEHWLRKRAWGPMQVLLTIFALVEPGRRSSYQSACKTAFAWADKRFGWKREPDSSGFTVARNRVTEADCLRLLDGAKSMALNQVRPKKGLVCGYLPVGVDGSILHMPRSQELLKVFGVQTDKWKKELCHYPQALLVSAWDLVRRIPLAWNLGSHKGSERSMLLGLLDQLPLKTLLLLDRGYPSDAVFGKILDSGRHFVARMVASRSAWKEVADFLASGKRDAVVPVEVGEGESRRIVRLRMILRTFARGRPRKHQKREVMVVITSLLDQTLTARDVCRLYGARWGVETIYREMKAIAVIEHWHGRSLALVRQELILLLVWFCFAAILAAAALAHRAGRREDDGAWRANTRRVFEAIETVIDALLAQGQQAPEVVEELRRRADSALRSMCRWMMKIRLGRSFPRAPLHPYARKI